MRFRPNTLLTRLSRSRTFLVGLAVVAGLAIAGTTVGYASMRHSMTLNVDGRVEHISSAADTVGGVLDAQGIHLGPHDEVAPAVDQSVGDGSAISVVYGRRLTVKVDGGSTSYWVTATDVRGALDQINRSFDRSRLSVSRSAGIGRGGLVLDVVTPKRLTVAIGGARDVHRTVAALTVAQALKAMHVHLGLHDVVRPGRQHRLTDGDRLVLIRIRIVERHVSGEPIAFATSSEPDATLLKGQTTVARAGRAGARDVTYRLTYRNGALVARRVLSQHLLRPAITQLERVGTKAPATDFTGGTTVWDKLAQCEAGGNWAANTGNGYYGGLQFSLGTWRAYGGPGLPSSASRLTQIAIASKVRDASGGYGAWPACSRSLGLPQ